MGRCNPARRIASCPALTTQLSTLKLSNLKGRKKPAGSSTFWPPRHANSIVSPPVLLPVHNRIATFKFCLQTNMFWIQVGLLGLASHLRPGVCNRNEIPYLAYPMDSTLTVWIALAYPRAYIKWLHLLQQHWVDFHEGYGSNSPIL